jgi:hypothetical protein
MDYHHSKSLKVYIFEQRFEELLRKGNLTIKFLIFNHLVISQYKLLLSAIIVCHFRNHSSKLQERIKSLKKLKEL